MPSKNQLLLLAVIFCIPFFSYSQQDLLDFIVKVKDTIYGTIRSNGTNNRLWFYHRVTKGNGKSAIRERKISKKKIKVFRKNGKIYELKDGDYYTVVPKIPDHLVTTNGDSIFGEFKKNILLKEFLLGSNGIKHSLSSDSVISYSKNNETYKYVNKHLGRVILEGPVSLYYVYDAHPGVNRMDFKADFSGVYIKKGEEFQRVYRSGFYPVTQALFGDNEVLMKRIKEREFDIENIYLVAQIYNRYLKENNITF